MFGRLSELTGDDDVEGAVADLVADANARGVVGIVDFEFGAGYARWPERIAAGLDTLRVRPAVYPELLDAVVEAGLQTGQDLAAGLITMGPLKIISDGSLNTRTAYCCEPYVDAGSLEFPRGKVNFPLDGSPRCCRRRTAPGSRSRCTPSSTRPWSRRSRPSRRRGRTAPSSTPSS